MDDQKFSPAFDEKNIPVVLASSDYYAPYAGVFIQSLLECADDKNNYDIIIFEQRISSYNKLLLTNMVCGKKNISVRFYDPTEFLSQTDVSTIGTKQFPIELYFRVLAPYMLPLYSRIITIDVDTLLRRDIADLFGVDLCGACMGAVPDILWQGFYEGNYVFQANQLSAREYFNQILKMKNPLNYFSGGVVVYDCIKYREELNWETIISTAKSRPFMWQDQCEMNVLLEGKVKYLDFAWNVAIAVNSRSEFAIRSAPDRSRRAYELALKAPSLLHWAGRPKPWVCPDVPYGNEWWETAMKTPFMGHIFVRMFDALQERSEYFRSKYGEDVAVWEPTPEIDRYIG